MAVDAFSRIPLFTGLDLKQISELRTWMENMDFSAGTLVFEEGSTPDGLYILYKGRIEVFRKVHSELQSVSSIQAPSVFGEMSLLTTRTRSVSVRATTEVSVGLLKDEVFQDLIRQRNPTAYQIGYNAGRIACVRLLETSEELHALYEQRSKTVDGAAESGFRSAIRGFRDRLTGKGGH